MSSILYGLEVELLDVSKLKNMEWEYKVDVKKGVELVYEQFLT